MRIEQGGGNLVVFSHRLIIFCTFPILTQPKKKPLASQQANPGRKWLSPVFTCEVLAEHHFGNFPAQ